MATTKMRLYSGPLSMFGAKAYIAMLEKRLDFDLVMVPFNSDDRYLPKHPEVARINPKQQVPLTTIKWKRCSVTGSTWQAIFLSPTLHSIWLHYSENA
jgi:hypothetical protein